VLLCGLLALAVLQGLSRFLALLTLALLLWAVCFRPREVAATLVGLVVSSLVVLHPGWFAVLVGLALVARWVQQP
jgi:hypothetical protein